MRRTPARDGAATNSATDAIGITNAVPIAIV
jgi:hypothetical protein